MIECLERTSTNMHDFTIVTAVTPEYRNHLLWAMSSWVYKPQLRNRPLIVYQNGMKARDLRFITKMYKNSEIIKWEMDGVESKSELMFSAFVFGAAKHVKTPYYMKLDADAFCINANDIWEDSDFNFDIIGHKWNYTKPGWYIDALENYYSGTNNELDKSERRRVHRRFESYCCLHRTEWVRGVVGKLNGRLPVPSHDTTLWFYADKEGKWGRKNIKRCGVDNASRWKSIREHVCSGDVAFNPIINEVLLSNVQLEITPRCNIGCNQCDRNCGLVSPGPDMSIAQIWQFVEESLNANKKWSRIDIIGGEPLLYKKLNSVFEIIKVYKNRFPKCKIRLSTNGFGDQVNEALKIVPDWVAIRNSSKTSKEQKHDYYRCAPVDVGTKVIKSCSVPWRCGIGLTRYGYFPCGAGASLARVFGLDIGIKQLKDVTPQNLKKQMIQLCKYCGHSNSLPCDYTSKTEMSESWEKAVKSYSLDRMSVI